MNKSEIRELNKCKEMLMAYTELEESYLIDMAARTMSALVRAAMSEKSRRELMSQAIEMDLVNHPEFIC